eukprot:11542617-Ditylum_brightwellii.AAC.1
MGWTESPPYFCSELETARDTIQILADNTKQLPVHQLEKKSPAKYTEEQDHHLSDKTMLEVFVDDFIAATNRRTK